MNIAVRKLRKKQRELKALTFYLCLGLLTTSCLVDPAQNRTGSGGKALKNTQDTVSAGYGRVLAANPLILSDYSADEDTDLSTLITRSPVPITNNQYLIKDCTMVANCLEVTEDTGISPFYNETSQWAFPVTSTEFLQINAYYHMSKIMDTYLSDMQNYYNIVYPDTGSRPYSSTIPSDSDQHKSFWKSLTNSSSKLIVEADSSLKDNASFSPSNFKIRLGYLSGYTNLKMAQDPSVIYHEFGHTVVERLMNHRNRSYAVNNCLGSDEYEVCSGESQLGYFAHDDALSINEGLSDYFSYFVNSREHMGEWGLGKFKNASRPLSEDDSLHIAGISSDSDSRLRYPEYLGYNVYSPEKRIDDIHLDGQIISHFLVALTKEFQNKCTGTHTQAKKLVFYTLAETLAELGDLTAKAKDSFVDQINLDINYAHEWLKSVKPVNFRNFSQAFARNVLKMTIQSTSLCPLNSFSKDDLEQLLDSYGLLLFRTYNTNYNFTGTSGNVTVNQLNRKKSELISKNLLIEDTRSTYSDISVFDIRSTIYQTIRNQMKIEEVTTTDARYNNGNGQVSPGEIVGIFANVFNKSNSIMAGTRVLASDWAHMQDGLPCTDLSDNFPSLAQGGTTCDQLTKDNYDDSGRIMPVCMLTYNDGSSTKILNQHEFLKKMKSDIGLLEQDCLGQGEDRTQDDLNNCFVKAIPSANTQNIPFMLPNSNWQETMQDEQGQPIFTDSNLMFFEINKNIPIGTEVTCRLRTTFSNCDDCYHDSQSSYDDFSDFEFAGEKPFNILNINFKIGQ
ncbi:hypothetical protein [Halobacteriovorax sp.]|uniref:hypothetical protein n=1 Tax=Halobacteriovorax sp. TaxID=2020862 RepID=UPI003AF2E96C